MKGISSSFSVLLFLFTATSAFFHGEFITQLLNPTDSFDTRQWENRYFVDNDSYVEGGPIFVHVGGPDFYMADTRMNLSHFFEIGQDMGALFVFTEHRFYGESRPTINTTLANLQFLDTRHALADIANLVGQLKSQHGSPPVILHGYDHGGALAVWFRQFYPDLVDGVWASSASLHARMDFGEYLVNIGLAIRNIGGEQCYQDMEEAFINMGTAYDNRYFSTLEEHFYLCAPFTGEDPFEEAAFFAFYSMAISEILRYTHSYGIELLCEYLDESEDPMVGLANFVRLVLPVCVPIDAYETVNSYLDIEWDTVATELGARQLSYQLCRDFGWFRSSSYPNQPFGSRYPIDLFYDQCRLLFGPSFTEPNMLQMVDNTNRIFGGTTPNVTNVYFTDGDLDPAKVLGVLEPYADEIYVDIIPNFAAGAEILISATVTDPVVQQVQARARELIGQWVAEAARQ